MFRSVRHQPIVETVSVGFIILKSVILFMFRSVRHQPIVENRNRFCWVNYTESSETIYFSVDAIATDGLKSSISLRQTIFGMKLIMIATEEWAFNQFPQHFLQAF